jgi:hypothetical protein
MKSFKLIMTQKIETRNQNIYKLRLELVVKHMKRKIQKTTDSVERKKKEKLDKQQN